MSDDYWESAYTSGEYEHWEFNYPSPELVALVAAGIIPPGGRVLDVGCGGGREAIFLAQCGFQVIGVDISRAALAIARKRAREARVHIDWRRGDVLALPVDDASMDFINDRGLFHLIDDADRPRYAAELTRVCKPGGSILIRGAGEALEERFNPVTEAAIATHFPALKFQRGPVLPIPLLSVAGVMDGRIAVLHKIG